MHHKESKCLLFDTLKYILNAITSSDITWRIFTSFIKSYFSLYGNIQLVFRQRESLNFAHVLLLNCGVNVFSHVFCSLNVKWTVVHIHRNAQITIRNIPFGHSISTMAWRLFNDTITLIIFINLSPKRKSGIHRFCGLW